MSRKPFFPLASSSLLTVVLVAGITSAAHGQVDQPAASLHSAKGHDNPPKFDVFTESTWNEIQSSIDRGIGFLIRNQNANGSFGKPNITASGITSIVGMSLISRGHSPGDGVTATPEAKTISRAVDFVLGVARPDGLMSRRQSDYSFPVLDKSAIYNHAITGLFLCEVYGMVDQARAKRIEVVVPRALAYVRRLQQRPLPISAERNDRGGWRYDPAAGDGGVRSDLSVTAWVVMFMRSAENAGFDVPKDWADEALRFVKRCYVPQEAAFSYSPGMRQMVTRAMVGAGVLCLSLTGRQEPEMERGCGTWLTRHPPTRYNTGNQHEHYHYSLYYSSQAALQLGDEYWANVYGPIYLTLLRHQNADGSWQPESRRPELGNEYTTALGVLALTPPYQLLPIYQR